MTDVQVTPTSSTAAGPPEPDLAALQASVASLLAQQKEVLEAVKPVPAPKPPAPEPPAPTGRVTQADYEQLAQYAAQQRQRAERLNLAKEFGLEESDLEGDFDSPADMRRHAELLALRKQVSDLTGKLAVVPPTTEEGAPPLVPDTGGPTGTQGTGDELAEAYKTIRARGKTPEARRQLLELMYRDPSRRSSYVPESE